MVGQVDAIPRKPHFIAPQTQAERSLHSLRVARREALRKAVELQQESFTLYESAPQTPYELMRREIKLRTKSSQTRDDDSGAATQTEEIERDDQACHAPDDLATTARRALQDQSDSARTAATLSANTARLNRFLGAASAVVEALCVENALAGALGDGGLCPHSELPMASRSAELVPPSPFDGRPPVDISFAPGAGGVLVAYGAHPGDKPRGKRREEVALRRAAAGGILCVWSVHQPAEPREVLRCAGLPTCCAIASAPCRVALAGTAEGAVQLWDLRDSEARHERATLGGAMRALRSAAFSSHGCALNEGHEAPVVALALAPPTAAAEAEDLVATSLDSAGRLLVWQLLEGSLTQLGERLSEEGLPREGDGLNLDAFAYGQTVGARLRLVRTSAVHVCAPPARAVAAVLPATALCLALLPLDPSRCLVGLDNGRLVQVSRYANARPSPAEFAPPPDSSRARAVTCLAFSPSLCSAFLAGRADGSVSLYTLSASLPLLVLEPPALAPAVQLLWSPSRPCAAPAAPPPAPRRGSTHPSSRPHPLSAQLRLPPPRRRRDAALLRPARAEMGADCVGPALLAREERLWHGRLRRTGPARLGREGRGSAVGRGVLLPRRRRWWRGCSCSPPGGGAGRAAPKRGVQAARGGGRVVTVTLHPVFLLFSLSRRRFCVCGGPI